MRETYVVILDAGLVGPYAYGPFHDGQTAYDFAAYLTKEVDPATVVLLRDPARELLAYWKTGLGAT
jgi:hypothetical protein